MMILKEFSRIVCVSLFSYQGSFVLLYLRQLVYFIISIIVCQYWIFNFFKLLKQTKYSKVLWRLSHLQNYIHVDISESITKLPFEIGHLMTSSLGVICSQMFNPVCKQPSVSKLTPFCLHSVLTAFSLVGQALTLLVAVSSMCYHTSTPALSTSSSSRGFTPFGWDISSWGGLHA